MGMGDKQKSFTPSYKKRDDVIGKEFAECAVRSCPEPHVIKRYGTGGQVFVSIYTCRRCKYHREEILFNGVGCNYGVEQSVPGGTES